MQSLMICREANAMLEGLLSLGNVEVLGCVKSEGQFTAVYL